MELNNKQLKIILPPPPTAPNLLNADAKENKLYWDRSNFDSTESQQRALSKSSTLYVGNLAFSTRVSHLRSLFSSLGSVKKIHMGLDRNLKTPCGFAFVEYYRREHALSAVAYLSGTKLDEKVIRVELDAGFKPGRQYGRGKKGGQVRDDRRGSFDPKRHSWNSSNTISSRWQAPSRVSDSDKYGPSSMGNVSGVKRGRDDNDDINIEETNAKQSRFAGSDDDE